MPATKPKPTKRLVTPTDHVLVEIAHTVRLDRKDAIGLVDHPDFNVFDIPPFLDDEVARQSRRDAEESGGLSWTHLLTEKFADVTAEATKFRPRLLRQEIAELAATCVSWIEALERRSPSATHTPNPIAPKPKKEQ